MILLAMHGTLFLHSTPSKAIDLLVPLNDGFDAYLAHYLAHPDAGYKRHQHFGDELAEGTAGV